MGQTDRQTDGRTDGSRHRIISRSTSVRVGRWLLLVGGSGDEWAWRCGTVLNVLASSVLRRSAVRRAAGAAVSHRLLLMLLELLVLMLELLVVTLVTLEPGAVALECVQDVLAVRIDQLRPRLPQRLHDELDKPDLQPHQTSNSLIN